MPATVAASHLGSLAMLMVEKLLDRKKKTVWADRRKRPYLYWLESLKKSTGISQDKLYYTMKYDAGVSLSTWSGDPTLPNPSTIHNMIKVGFAYTNFFAAFKIVHDYYKQFGFTVVPNDSAQSIETRARKMSGSEYEALKSKLMEDIDSFDDSFERRLDLAVHKQGSGTDIVGLNGLMPVANTGSFGGHDRTREPLVQHVSYAGSNAAIPSGITHIGGSGTTGASGTLLPTIEKAIRELRANTAQSELPSGEWVAFAGSGFIEKVKSEYRRLGQTWSSNSRNERGKSDLILLDEDLEIGKMPFVWDPTLDTMDSVASAEQGGGLSANAATLTHNLGTGAAFVARTSSGGVVTDLILTARGSGYLAGTAPTFAVAGGGTGLTVNLFIYGASASTMPATSASVVSVTKVLVDDDDKRIGQVAYVTVQAGGTGYGNTSALLFTDRCYLLYRPCWEFLYQDGLDKKMSIPADSARSRATEVQCDATYFLINRFPRANGLIHAA